MFSLFTPPPLPESLYALPPLVPLHPRPPLPPLVPLHPPLPFINLVFLMLKQSRAFYFILPKCFSGL